LKGRNKTANSIEEFAQSFKKNSQPYLDCVTEEGIPMIMIYKKFQETKTKIIYSPSTEDDDDDNVDYKSEEEVNSNHKNTRSPPHKLLKITTSTEKHGIKRKSKHSKEETFEEENTNFGVVTKSEQMEKVESSQPNKKIKIEYPKDYKTQLERLFRKNSTLSKIDLKDILNYEEFAKLTLEEKRELSKDLPSIDLDENGIATNELFKHQFFRHSRRQLHDIIEEGYLHPSRDFRQEVEENQEINKKNGTRKEGVQTFWLDVSDKITVNWISELY
jgi:hypothetical protein